MRICRKCHRDKVWDKYKCALAQFEEVKVDSQCELCKSALVTTVDCLGRPLHKHEKLEPEIAKVS